MNVIYNLDLCDEPFKKIKDGSKIIEMRLNDEKRRLVEVGDYFLFTNEVSKEQMKVKVIDIFHFDSFVELYAHFDKSLLGYQSSEMASPDDMLKYYSKEKIEKYGVIGFKISKVL